MSGKVIKGLLIGAALITGSILITGPGIWAFGTSALKAILLSAGASITLNTVFPGGLRQKQGLQLQGVIDTQATLPVVYGRTKLGIRYADRRTGGTDNKYLYIVGALCSGSEDGTGIAGIDEVYFDDRLAVDAAGTIQDAFAGKLTCAKYLGTDAQTVDATMTAAFPAEWPSTSKGRRVAYLVLRLEYDPEVYPTGEPTITAIVRGQKVKDPINLANPAIYNANPSRCLYDYLTSTTYGLGCAPSEVDTTSFASMASYYDTVVEKDAITHATGTLFATNGALDVGVSVNENIKQLLSSCRGTLIYEGGKYRLTTRRVVSPTSFALTEANIVGDWGFNVPGIEAPNTIHALYVEPGVSTENYPHQVQTRIWPRPGAPNGYLTADNSYEIIQELALPFTNDVYTAEQIALVNLKESRSGISCTVTATEAALQLQVGDLVPVTHPTPGWVSKNFWVMGVFLIPNTMLVRLALVEYDATAYTLDALNTVPTPPSTSLPNPFTCQAPGSADPTNEDPLTLVAGDDQASPDRDGSTRVYIEATWIATVDPYLDYYDVQYRRAGTTKWIPVPDENRADLTARIGPVSEGTQYDVRVRAINTLGVPSAFILDTITPHLPTFHRSGSKWIDDFTSQTPGRRWVKLAGAGTFLDEYDPDSIVGGKVGRARGEVWYEHVESIPYDPNLLYIMRWRVRQLRDPGVGAKQFSIGLMGLAQQPGQPGVFNYVNTFGADSIDNQHWVVAKQLELPPSREWRDYYGFVKGYAGGKVTLDSSQLSHSGLGSFSAANCVDGDTSTTQTAFNTNAAVAGAYVKFDFGASSAGWKTITEYRFHQSAAGSVASWDLEFSDNNVDWTTVT